MATSRQPRTSAPTRESPQSSASFDWLVVLLSTSWVGGIFLGGWAHNHIPQLETFFTPWHAALYFGFLVVALFPFGTLGKKHSQGYSWEHAMARGFSLSLVVLGGLAS